MSPAKTPPAAKQRLVAVTLDEETIGRSNPDIEHERQVAIYDLLEQNSFAPVGNTDGPYELHLSITGNRLVFDIRTQDGKPVVAHLLSLSPLRRIVKDYYTVCDSYYQAIRTATPDKIEALDMGRRSIHNDGSRILMERLKDKVKIDIDTARRLFTLICVLHWKGLNPAMAAPSRPQAVLFACGMNSVRSPMAAGLFQQLFGKTVYVGSAGVQKGELDPFAVAVMAEIGIDIARHKPVTFEELDELEGLNFDLIVTLSPPAHHKALELTRTMAADVEYWPTEDPTVAEGNREQRLAAYREVRDQLMARIHERFGRPGGRNE